MPSDVVQFGAVPEVGIEPWAYNASINVDAAGNALVNFSQSAAGECPSMYAAVRLNADDPGTLQTPVMVRQAGAYDSPTAGGIEPWGRYSAVAVDPVDQCFWIVNEYASTSPPPAATSLWGTHVAKVCASLEGACCFGEKACSMRVQATCVSLGGNFRGIGSKCPTQDVSSAMHGSVQVVHWVNPAVNCSQIVPLVGLSNCCVARPSPGCDTPSCESQVCAANSFCCDFEWEPSCVQLAQNLCAGLCSAGCDPSFAIDPWVTLAPSASSAQPISIPDSGAASPYPSEINVAGLAGTVTSVSLSLNGIRHTWPDDIDVLLVGPSGQSLVVMSDAGGSTDVDGVSLALSDAASSSLPDTAPLASGTFRPANFPPPDTFPPPAPSPSGASTLSVFNGTNPNGTWRLWVVDGFTNDSGTIGSWSLNITTSGGGTAGHATCDSTFNSLPIPADFFGPGSQPFSDTICYQGVPLGSPFDPADTLVRRYGDPFPAGQAPSPASATVPIEIVALSLVSIHPITVQTFSQTTDWNVAVDLSTIPSPPGSLTATKTHCNGGTWESVLPVQPRFTFTRIDDPSQVRVLDTGQQGYPPIVLQVAPGSPWVVDLDPDLHIPGSECTSFHPNVRPRSTTTSCDCNLNGRLDSDDVSGGFSPDVDANGVPDECDPDTDGDGRIDGRDNCPGVANAGQGNVDGDRYGDVCDICPVLAECLDGDHDCDHELEVPEIVLPPGDNCPCTPNPDQVDTDGDGIGNACECLNVTCTPQDGCHLAGTCDPATGACSNPPAPDGSACDDGDACTTVDVCTSGVCAGTAGQAPAEAAGLRVDRVSTVASIDWNASADADSWDVVRGILGALPVGPGDADETCLANDTTSTDISDGEVPPIGTAFWYVVRGENECGSGSYGFEAAGGVPQLARATSTCSGRRPCAGAFNHASFHIIAGNAGQCPEDGGACPGLLYALACTQAKLNSFVEAGARCLSRDNCREGEACNLIDAPETTCLPDGLCTNTGPSSFRCRVGTLNPYDCECR